MYSAGGSQDLTWEAAAALVIQAVVIHHATMNPKNLAYLGPALAAAQIYIDPLIGMAEQISAKTAAVIIRNTIEMMYEDLEFIDGTFESLRG